MRRYLALVVVCAVAVVAAGCGAVDHITASSGTPTTGKALFSSHCAACHTLAADAPAAVGTIGPNLDYAFGPDRCQGFNISTIRDIVYGQIYYANAVPETTWPPGSANVVQGMPDQIVTGKAAADVADYVALVAGRTSGPGKYFDCATGAYAG